MVLSPRQERAIRARDEMETGGKPAPLVPSTFLEAQAFAGALAESPLMPEALRKQASNVLVVILAGIELGLTPMQSIRLHHVIEGVPRLSSAGIAGIVLASPLCEYLRCIESTETRSTWVTKRVGEPEKSCTWTIERANKAGLVRKTRNGDDGMWMKYPTNMLNSRARKEVCEMVYPDLCAGLLSAEEAEDMVAERTRAAAEFKPQFVAPPALPRETQADRDAQMAKDGVSRHGPPPGVPATEPARRGRPPKPPVEVAATERPTSSPATSPSVAGPSPASSSTAEAIRPDLGEPAGGSATKFNAAVETARAADVARSAMTLDSWGQPIARPTPPASPSEPSPSTASAAGSSAANGAAADDSFGEDPEDKPAPSGNRLADFFTELARCVNQREVFEVGTKWRPWSVEQAKNGDLTFQDRGVNKIAMMTAYANRKREVQEIEDAIEKAEVPA